MTDAVGVDVGGSSIKAVRLGPRGVAEERLRRPTPLSADAILDAVCDVAGSLGPRLPVGVGLAGLVDNDRGVLVWAPHIPGEELAVGRLLSGRLGVGVSVDNDANLAGLAEHRRGAARGADSVAMITLGTGIGLGLVLEGRVFRGRAHAGEAGHVTVESPGEPCACGRRGCWETKVSGTVLDGAAVRILGEGHGGEDLMAAARAGNLAASRAVEEAGEWLGVGIEALVLVLDPEVVVVGGGPSGGGDLLLGPVRRRLARTEGGTRRRSTAVLAGMLGPEAGAIGAAIMAMEENRDERRRAPR